MCGLVCGGGGGGGVGEIFFFLALGVLDSKNENGKNAAGFSFGQVFQVSDFGTDFGCLFFFLSFSPCLWLSFFFFSPI